MSAHAKHKRERTKGFNPRKGLTVSRGQCIYDLRVLVSFLEVMPCLWVEYGGARTGRHTPSTFIQGWPLRMIRSFLEDGRIFSVIYRRKKR